MARSVRDALLDTRTARSRLKAAGKPYYRQLEPGLSLGYRKALSGPGKWVIRHHLGGKADYETETFGTADDFSDADGIAILNFWQAQVKARERMVERAHGPAKIKASLTVADCVDQYIKRTLKLFAPARRATSTLLRSHIEQRTTLMHGNRLC